MVWYGIGWDCMGLYSDYVQGIHWGRTARTGRVNHGLGVWLGTWNWERGFCG